MEIKLYHNQNTQNFYIFRNFYDKNKNDFDKINIEEGKVLFFYDDYIDNVYYIEKEASLILLKK
ncbi:hypothetical protein [Marinitoga lauensis]|uniref:hypothetical protein n=1 Tax=Marinitoga lauensis TaxID=2201189 RepID=UPI001980075E|nr:hypothetical protein [Marinitoga lauensis]